MSIVPCPDCAHDLAELEAYEEEIREADKRNANRSKSHKVSPDKTYDELHAEAKALAERKFTKRGLAIHRLRKHEIPEDIDDGIPPLSSRFLDSRGRSVFSR